MPALDVILHHHEHVDGGGYPHDLKLPELSLLARMGAICDVYDALTSERPYKTAWDPAESLARMASWRGKLDRAVLAEFVQSIGIYPPGSVVRLESRRVAVVLENHSARPTTPVVRTFFSLRCNMPIAQETIDLSRDGATDRIVGRVDRNDGSFAVSDEVWASAMGVDRKRFAALAQNG